jgi:hypothetical protein
VFRGPLPPHGPGPPSLPLFHHPPVPPPSRLLRLMERLEAVPLGRGSVTSPGPALLPVATGGRHLPSSRTRFPFPDTCHITHTCLVIIALITPTAVPHFHGLFSLPSPTTLPGFVLTVCVTCLAMLSTIVLKCLLCRVGLSLYY